MRKSIVATLMLFIISAIVVLLAFGMDAEQTDKKREANFSNDIPVEGSLSIDEEDKIFIRHRQEGVAPLLSEYIAKGGREIYVPNDRAFLEGDFVGSSKQVTYEDDMEEAHLTAPKSAVPAAPKIVTPSVDITRLDAEIKEAELAMRITDEQTPLIALSKAQSEIYRYETLPIILRLNASVNADDVNVYVRNTAEKRLSQNGDGRYEVNLIRVGSDAYRATYLHPFGGPTGAYEFVVYYKGKETKRVYTDEFFVTARPVKPVEKTMSVITMEYNLDIRNKRIPQIGGGFASYEGFYDWARFMEADSFWALAGQTSGWDSSISEKKVWGNAPIANVEALAASKNKKNVTLGAYIMSYFTPGEGNIKANYKISIGYDRKNATLYRSRHISFDSQRRLNDIVELMQKFNANPNIDYVGLDFIRTGERDGLEMVDDFVEKTGVIVPAGWGKKSETERMTWLGQNIGMHNREINMKWRWYRAHRASMIIKTIKDAGIDKPLWCFTLGWGHGEEHGQDPYMFFDAGAHIDAVMLYEASHAQFKNMMLSWPRYLNGPQNIFIGNMMDSRLLDGGALPQAEYLRRYFEAADKLNRNNRIRGVFYHDISRAFWSKNRGANIEEWAYVNAAVISRIRMTQNETPVALYLAIDEKSRTGKITVDNRSDTPFEGITIEYFGGENIQKISFNKRAIDILEGGGKQTIGFSYEYTPGREGTKNIIAVRIRLSDGRSVVAVVYTNLDNATSIVRVDTESGAEA